MREVAKEQSGGAKAPPYGKPESPFVGADAHIRPLLGREVRVDVGIDPYIHTFGSKQTLTIVSWE